MERTEYIIASIVSLSVAVSLLHPSLSVLILADVILLFCSALLYLKALAAEDGEWPYVWSIAFVPISMAPAVFCNEPRSLVGFAPVATFMIFRSVVVFLHNQKIRTDLRRKSELESIGQQIDHVARRLDVIDPVDADQIQVEEVAKAVLRTLRDERVDFSNGRILQNEEVRTLLLDSFDKAVQEVDIVSPWVNKVAVNRDLLLRMEQALKRNVNIRIIYGIKGNYESDIERLAKAESVIAELQERFKGYGKCFSARLDNTHEKLLLCDDSFMAVGSYNLLSFDGNYENASTRKEMMYYFENPEQIRKTRKMYFS